MRHVQFRVRATLLSMALCVLIAGCGGYPAVSPTAYAYAKALYSITNRKAEDRLDDVDAKIRADGAAGKLSEEETGWLTGIVADAKSGDWDSANQAARQIMEDQIK
jgi:hypothetical protein